MDKIGAKRDEEIKHVRNQAMTFATSGFMWLITPVMVSTLSFTVFCLTGGILTAPKVRTTLAFSPSRLSHQPQLPPSPSRRRPVRPQGPLTNLPFSFRCCHRLLRRFPCFRSSAGPSQASPGSCSSSPRYPPAPHNPTCLLLFPCLSNSSPSWWLELTAWLSPPTPHLPPSAPLQSGVALQRLESFLLSKEVVQSTPESQQGETSAAAGGAGADGDQRGPVLPVLHDPALVSFSRCLDPKALVDADLPLVSIEGQ